MLVPNCCLGLETILAPMKAGMGVVPMNVRLHPHEHEYMLNDSGVRVLIYHEDFRPHLAGIRARLRTVERFLVIGRGEPADLSFEELLAGESPSPPDVVIQREDLAWLFYTSGTTGRPKAAMLSHRNLLAMAQIFLLDLNPARETDVLLHAGAITHGSGVSIFHHIARGAASAFPATRAFEPRRIFEAIQRYRVTTMFLAPTMIHMLATSGVHYEYDLSSLHTVFYGGGPMYVEQQQEAVRVFGPIFCQLFGHGEAPLVCTTLPKEAHLPATILSGGVASARRDVRPPAFRSGSSTITIIRSVWHLGGDRRARRPGDEGLLGPARRRLRRSGTAGSYRGRRAPGRGRIPTSRTARRT
jgi:acyl-CoA synthetase (AMP-forming)/AMP-acid ligase II